MWPDMYERTPKTEYVVDFHRRGFAKLRENWEEIRREQKMYIDWRYHRKIVSGHTFLRFM